MKVKKLFTKVLIGAFCATLSLGVATSTVWTDDKFDASASETAGFKSDTHTVFKDTESTLAPGVTQNIKYAYAKDGKQMVYYVATADVTRDDVVVQSSYLNQHENGIMGMAKLTEQAAYANQKYTNPNDPLYISEYYNVVAGVNASFYNMQTGQPMGITYIDGVSFGTNSYDNFFAILKDGKTAVIDYASNLGKYVDENGNSTIWQAAAGSQWLVREGKDVTGSVTGSYNTDRHSRTCVGVTAEGKVVLMVLDGRQEPFSCGGSMHELAQIMLEAGCVAAVNLDGGGSTTFASKPEGANNFKVINRPSDGSERSISSGIIIASTTAPSNVFERASLTAADEYVTPGTATDITVAGVSPAGTAAELPQDITYTVTNGTYADGVLTADKAGDVVLTAMHQGKAVGSVTVHAVLPEKIAFSAENITVPYGKTLALEMTATYGLNEVKTKAEDFRLTLENTAAGSLSGLDFTACAENAGVSSSKITAVLVGAESVTATATLTMGKGSQVMWDFEDGDISDWKRSNKASYNYILTPGTVSLSYKAEGGIVHSGDYALRFNMDFSVSTEGGYLSGLLGLNNEEVIDLGGATSFGMWMYVPIEAKSLNGRIYLREVTERNADGSVKSYKETTNSIDATIDGDGDWNVGFVTQYEESGWHYISFDLTRNGELGFCIPENGVLLDIYVNDRDNTKYNYNHLEHKSLNQNVVMYIDDVTLDYSSVVDDREAPIFSGVTYADDTMSDAATLAKGATLRGKTLSFAATVAENTEKANATGLDAATAKAYIDGREVKATFDGNKISVSEVQLVNGNHTVKFSVCDKQGNYASVIRKFTVKADNNDLSTILLKAHNPDLDKILLGSVYYVDIVATHAETVNSVVVDLDLNNISRWQLDHMEVAKGFKAEYQILDADENIARVTITKEGKTSASGELALVSMPIRTWELPCLQCDNSTGKKGRYATYEFFKAGSETWPIDISVTVIAGILNDKTTFAGDNVQVDTESYVWDNATKPAEYATWNGGHDHRPETKDLYSAGSTNHVDAIKLDDKAATCTEAGYTGRTYCEVCDSVVDWGKTIPAQGHTYALVDDAFVCTVCDDVYDAGTGLFQMNGKWYYSKVGSVVGGWVMINEEWYYFDEISFTTVETYNNGKVTFAFEENGKLVSGQWYNDGVGTKYYYGPDYYKAFLKTNFTSWQTIDGDKYNFNYYGYRSEGIEALYESAAKAPNVYRFTEDGIYVGVVEDGLIETKNGDIYYVKNGFASYAGLVKVGDNYYYISGNDFKAVKNCTKYITYTNRLLPAGKYVFGPEGKLVPKQGVYLDDDGEIRYYVDDVATYAGLVQDKEGNYYYISGSTLTAIKNCTRYISYTNELLPAKTYTFGADGKLIYRQGVYHDEDGEIRYYVNDVATYAGLVQDKEGNYYYISGSTLTAIKNCTRYISYTSGLLPAKTYTFGADGKLILKQGVCHDEDGEIRYYVNDVATAAGLVKDADENYYYISEKTLTAIKNCVFNVANTNGLLPAGEYKFGADGRIIFPKNGVVKDSDGEVRYYVNDVATYAGLVQDKDENYYYISGSTLTAVKNCTKYITYTNGLLVAGNYAFDAEGKLVLKQGVQLDHDGEIRYYENSKAIYAGLVQDAEGNYYYISGSTLTAIKNCTKYITYTNGLLPTGNYTFDEAGRMITGR